MADLKKWLPFKRRKKSQSERPREARPAVQSANELRTEMDRLLDTFFGSSFWRDAFPAPSAFGGVFGDFSPASFEPRIDIADHGSKLTVSAELPGMDADDVEVTVHDRAVTLRGEKKLEDVVEEQGYYRAERGYGWFERTIPLPVRVDAERAEARFRKGVLDLRLPKLESDQPSGRRIQVTAG